MGVLFHGCTLCSLVGERRRRAVMRRQREFLGCVSVEWRVGAGADWPCSPRKPRVPKMEGR